MKKKNFIIVFLLIIITVSFSGCGKIIKPLKKEATKILTNLVLDYEFSIEENSYTLREIFDDNMSQESKDFWEKEDLTETEIINFALNIFLLSYDNELEEYIVKYYNEEHGNATMLYFINDLANNGKYSISDIPTLVEKFSEITGFEINEETIKNLGEEIFSQIFLSNNIFC